MSFTIKNRNASLSAGQAIPITPAFSASPSFAKKVKLAWIAAVALPVMGFGSNGVMSAPAPESQHLTQSHTLVGSWMSEMVVGGSQRRFVYTFNKDNTVLETDSNQAGQTQSSSANYSYADSQVTISDSSRILEQATVTWNSPNQFHYRITKNSDPNWVGLNLIYTRVPTLTANQIAKDYLDNQLRANPKYKGKVLTFTGKVSNETDFIETDSFFGTATLYIKASVGHSFLMIGGGQGWEASKLICGFLKENIGQLKSINRGDLVTIQGTCDGGDENTLIMFHDCRIVNKP